MSADNVRHVAVRQMLGDMKDIWPIHLLGALASIISGFGVWKIADLSGGHSWVFGALIFLIWEGYVVYSGLAHVTADLAKLASVTPYCTILTGPHHAKVVGSTGPWTSVGVVWLALMCEHGSQVDMEIVTPPNTSIRWVNQGSTPVFWKFTGTSANGEGRWQLPIGRTDGPLTQLGQFEVTSGSRPTPQTAIAVTAKGSFAGRAIEHGTSIGVFEDTDEGQAFTAVT